MPLRLLWKSAPNALTQMGEKNPLQSTSIKDFLSVATGLPSMPISDISNALDRLNGDFGTDVNPTQVSDSTFGLNQFGFSRGSCANKLLTYLRYGSVVSSSSPLAQSQNMWSTTMKRADAPFSDIAAQNMFVNVLPILSYPGGQLIGTSIGQLVKDSKLQAMAMKAVAERTNSAASVSFMDLSVEAECFGAQLAFSDDEVPTVTHSVVTSPEEIDSLEVPAVSSCRAPVYVEAVRIAKNNIITLGNNGKSVVQYIE